MFECLHCAFSCTKGGHTMEFSDAQNVLLNLPKDPSELTLSGGDPFYELKLLEKILSFIHENRAEIIPNGSLKVETTGFWANTVENAYDIITMLVDYGVNWLLFSSHDENHTGEGRTMADIDSWAHNARIVINKHFNSTKAMNLSYSATDYILSFGRAENLPISIIRKQSNCSINREYKQGYRRFTIDPNGETYLCCWPALPSIGSAIDHNVEELFTLALDDEAISGLIRGGPFEAAYACNLNTAPFFSYLRNECLACKLIFREIKQQRQ